MKAILEFNLPEDSEELALAMKASNMSSAIFNIRQDVFRPARKHGYSDRKITAFLEKHPEGYELIEMLEHLFNEVLETYNVGDLS